MTTTASSDDDTGGQTVRLISSIAHGVIEDNPPQSQRQLSWSEFNALAQQTKAMQEQTTAMQERIDTLEQKQPQSRGSERVRFVDGGENGASSAAAIDSSDEEKNVGTAQKGGAGAANSPPGDDENRITNSQLDRLSDEYVLPESTYTLLMTEKLLSIPFFTGIIAVVLCMWSLMLAFVDEKDNGTSSNPLGLPAGVRTPVRMAQYLGRQSV